MHAPRQILLGNKRAHLDQSLGLKATNRRKYYIKNDGFVLRARWKGGGGEWLRIGECRDDLSATLG